MMRLCVWRVRLTINTVHCRRRRRRADTALKEDANKKAFDKFAENIRNTPEVKADGGASKRYMSKYMWCSLHYDWAVQLRK